MRDSILLCLLTACAPKIDADPSDDTGSTGEVSSSDETSTSISTTTPSSTSTSTTTSSTGDPTSTSETGSSSEDGGSSESTAVSELHAVSGTVTRSVEPTEGNDGVGPMYIALVTSCGFAFDIVAADVIANADPGRGAAFEIAGVPDGTFYFVAFLDDDGDAELPAPMPDSGDLVASDDVGGIECAEVVVDGADVSGVELDLDFVIP